MNPKKIKILDKATQLMGVVANKLAKINNDHTIDNISLLKSEIHASRFADRNYYNLTEKIAQVGRCRNRLEDNVKIINKQIERLKLVESVLNKVAED